MSHTKSLNVTKMGNLTQAKLRYSLLQNSERELLSGDDRATTAPQQIMKNEKKKCEKKNINKN